MTAAATVEPMVKPQWFVKMEEMAKPAIEAVQSQDVSNSFRRASEKTYLHWLEGIRDWCISRTQLWWGHRFRLITVRNAAR